MSKHEEKLAEAASLMEDVIHGIAHKEVHRQVSELRESVVFNAQRLTEMDKEVKDNSETLDSVEAHHEAFLAGVRQEMHQAVAEITNPDDQRIADLEDKIDQEVNDMNDRLLRLEEQMTTIIGHFAKMGNLD